MNRAFGKVVFVLVLLPAMLLPLQSCKKGKNNKKACNGSSTRREVKIATDEAAAQIDTIAIVTSVDSIGSIEVGEVKSESDRQPIEKRVFTITATVHKVSKHRDGDWKIKLTDGNDKFVNCESPNMGCEYISTSAFLNEMTAVRAWIEANENNLEGKTVTITGVAFVDIDHRYPRNAAENEIELHPILDIHF